MTIAVIFNLAQAKIFVNAGGAADEVVAFCLSAADYLQKHRYRVTSASSIYLRHSHARTAMLVARESVTISEAAARQYGLDYPEQEGLSVYLYHYLSCSYHLHFSLRRYRGAPRFVWVEGRTMQAGDYTAMFAAVTEQPARSTLAYAHTNYSAAHARVAMWCNRIIAFFIARSTRIKVIDYGDELPRRITRAMIENGENPLVINTHRVGKNVLKTLRFFIKSLVRLARAKADMHAVFMFRVACPARYRETITPFDIPVMFSHEVQNVTRAMIAWFVPFVRTEAGLGRQIVQATRPHIAISDHAKYAYILGGLEMLKSCGGKHAMLNHGTHTVQYAPISKLAGDLWARQQRVINRNTTHCLPKSPLTAEVARGIRGDDDYRICKINVCGHIENRASPDGKFIILQAGNYGDAYAHIPWCKDTSDEYLLATRELIDEVSALENVELIIKLKKKKASVHHALIEDYIRTRGAGDKVRVDTTGKFSDLMARAHLIVCNLSGTVEEALANHIPIMVHTYRKGYFHIAEETVKRSSIGDFAPAYLVKERSDIARIITFLDRHRGQLANPELFKHVAWQKDELMSMRSLAAELVQGVRG